jgi:hypothetical protein
MKKEWGSPFPGAILLRLGGWRRRLHGLHTRHGRYPAGTAASREEKPPRNLEQL